MRGLFLVALTALAGCVPSAIYTRPIPLGAQVDQFNTTAAASERLMIVRNIMRARDRTSMIFTRIQSFQGGMSRSVEGSAGLSLNEGSHNDSLSPGVTVSGSTSPTFDVAVLNDEKFHRAIETSIDLGLYQLLLQSGWRPQLLHTLFIERVVDHGHVIENDPGDYAAFHQWIRAHESLQICSRSSESDFGPAIALSGATSLEGMAALAHEQLGFRRGADGWHLTQTDVSRWLATSCDEADNAFTSVRVEMQAAPAPGGAGASPQVHYVSNSPGGQSAGDSADDNRIYVRSVEGVLFYLGEVVRQEQRRNGTTIDITVDGQDEPFFQVRRASDGHPTGLVFQHEDGKTYFIPYPPDPADANATHDRTHQVISLMIQLLGMLQSQDNVPQTATVRVVN